MRSTPPPFVCDPVHGNLALDPHRQARAAEELHIWYDRKKIHTAFIYNLRLACPNTRTYFKNLAQDLIFVSLASHLGDGMGLRYL